jgi:cytochrome bd ubiquinol oxidase subunit II
MLLPFLGKTDVERQVLINTLAPVWEGNEVWLIAAGAFLFAGFPHAYATLFSGLYLALLFILASLILRGVGFEFRDKEPNMNWRNFWDWSIFAGSLIPALLWGVALANLIKGLPIDAAMQYTGTFGDLLSLYTLMGGLIFVLLFLIHGTTYLTLKLEPYLVDRAKQAGLWLCKYALIGSIGFAVFTYAITNIGTKPAASAALLVSINGIFMVSFYLQQQKYVKGFMMSSISIVLLTLALFIGLFPRIIISSLDLRWSLDIYNTAANSLALKIMSITMLIVLPILIAFEVWKYNVFKQRVSKAEIEFKSHTNILMQMHNELWALIKYACCLADTMDCVIRAFRSKNGSVINRLEKKHRSLLFGGNSQKMTRERDTNDDTSGKECPENGKAP